MTTPSQTVGPFFSLGLPFESGPFAVTADTPGAFWLRGVVLDGAGEPVPDALIETWQADPAGRFDHPDDPRGAVATPGFRGFARCPTDTAGRYAIRTVRPGPVPGAGGAPQAPHIAVSVLARGLLDRLVTRIYFPDEEANAADPVLARVDPVRRPTLVAKETADGYAFDITLQGDHETVFFTF
ncbi:protocatechuate 3,4-dioxygenase subunit alpha [Asanoa siamensis]|uniref:Protocatechuate 3,4-dioxygenase subunit alpha n=1 Tax=Asanoa siamensis TaxID=926357 RepID=A0ABQ4CTA6_9ACTN|nr:protocatechuate 3,4-dioxygenase subunit alpha [Asanoa siamensis]GIF74515.1 protocatechuate 3,4-dioxygenase subunit alpha [Asanoa siamensis]